jgi:hypothetical protein
MIQEKIAQGDLLYHAVHGLCRVDEIGRQKESGKEVLSYSLVPKVANRMKVRFVIADTDLKASGFHALVSLKEANEILAYIEAGDIEAIPSAVGARAAASSRPENQAWELAREVMTFSREHVEVKDQRKRQVLERSVSGLVRELAFVFKATLKETAGKVRRSLGETPKINPSVLAALVHVGED